MTEREFYVHTHFYRTDITAIQDGRSREGETAFGNSENFVPQVGFFIQVRKSTDRNNSHADDCLLSC